MAHPFLQCPLHSDPGPEFRAPFFEAPQSDRRAFLPMDDGSFASAGCPPVDVYGFAGFADARWRPAPCLPESPGLGCFFGEGSHGPAVQLRRPLEGRLKGATR